MSKHSLFTFAVMLLLLGGCSTSPEPPVAGGPTSASAESTASDSADDEATANAAPAVGLAPWIAERLQPNHIGAAMIRGALIRQAFRGAGVWERLLPILEKAGAPAPLMNEIRDDDGEEYVVLLSTSQPLVLIRFAAPHTPEQTVDYFARHLAPGVAPLREEAYGERKVWTDLPADPQQDASGFARVQFDPQLVLVGPTADVRKYMAALDQCGRSQLPQAAAALTGQELLAVVATREPAEELIGMGKGMMPKGDEMEDAAKAFDALQSAVLTLSSEPFGLALKLKTNDEAGAKLIETQLNGYKAMPAAAWQIGRMSSIENAPKELRETMDRFATAGDEIVQSLKVKGKGTTVTVSAGFRDSLGQLAQRLVPAGEKLAASMEAQREREEPAKRLKTVLLACQNYLSAYQAFPHTGGMNEHSIHPGLSWRVAILPMIEETALYNEFHLNEPWDSEHNLKLVDRLPKVYAVPGATVEPGKTLVVQAIGPKTALPPGVVVSGNVSDRAVVLVHAAPSKAVVWTKPDDLVVDPDKLALGDLHRTLGGYVLAKFGGRVDSVEAIDAAAWKKHFNFPRKAQ